MWKSFKWKSCLGKDKRKSMNSEILAIYVRGFIEKYKENIMIYGLFFLWISSTNNDLNIFPVD